MNKSIAVQYPLVAPQVDSFRFPLHTTSRSAASGVHSSQPNFEEVSYRNVLNVLTPQ